MKNYIFAIISIFLLCFSAFFSGSEAALTSLSDYKLRKLFNNYKILRTPLKLWIYKPYRIIISILIGNTIVNLLLSSYFTRFVEMVIYTKIPKEIIEIIIWLTVTLVIIVFCELTPKIVAKNFSETVSKIVLVPIYFFQFLIVTIFSPVFYIVEKHIKKNPITYFKKFDEIKKIISDSSKEIFHKDIGEIFDRATKFSDVKVKDIMTPKEKVVMVNIANKPISLIIDEIIESGKTRVPLYETTPEQIVGYSLVKDIFYLCSIGTECSVSDIIHPILEVSLHTKAKDLIKEFKKSQIHIAKVVDENKKFCGIVTLEDVIEEVVGDILDEYDIRTAKEIN